MLSPTPLANVPRTTVDVSEEDDKVFRCSLDVLLLPLLLRLSLIPRLTSILSFNQGSERVELTNMPHLSWSGTASIKGSTEATRMALLTISLVGIQYVFPCPSLPTQLRIIHLYASTSTPLTKSAIGSHGVSK